MKYIYLFLTLVLFTGCNSGDGAKIGGSGSRITSSVVSTPTEYSIELSGNGVTYSADIHGYAERNYGGSQINPTYNSITLGATSVIYTITKESMIANITLNTGAGVLTITTRKNGNIMRSDTITTNATNITISDAN